MGPTKKLTHAGPMACDCQLRRDPGVVCSDWFDNQNVHNSKTSGQTMASTSSSLRPDRYSAPSVTPGNNNLRRKVAQNAQNMTTTKIPAAQLTPSCRTTELTHSRVSGARK